MNLPNKLTVLRIIMIPLFVAVFYISAIPYNYIISAGMEGYMYKNMPWWERILALVGGLCMVIPGIVTDLVGVALIALVFILQKTGAKKQNAKKA